MNWYFFVLGVLSVWRITHLFNAEDGPFNIIFLFRKSILKIKFLNDLFSCFYCLSVWVAAPFAFFIGESHKEIFLLWLALSGLSIILEKLTNKNEI
ncbi:MAG TPA: DUF1360 domain-containing protein [Bacteroidales bacterium]|nr:DUF1360 domain-containing protein [Bacteroidales bacterium]HPS16716.1 DUF1360 domain-containing protein [Bacteroidales bacterium]